MKTTMAFPVPMKPDQISTQADPAAIGPWTPVAPPNVTSAPGASTGASAGSDLKLTAERGPGMVHRARYLGSATGEAM
jgi:hypothetical protein